METYYHLKYLGPDLPVETANRPKALATPSKDGAYLLLDKSFYKFSCIPSKCSWHKMRQKMSSTTTGGVFMYLPKNYSCQG